MIDCRRLSERERGLPWGPLFEIEDYSAIDSCTIFQDLKGR
jgi:hypothetical protein